MISGSKTVAVLFYCSAMLIGAAAGIAIDRNYVHGKVDAMRDDPRRGREEFFAHLGVTPAQRAAWDSIRSTRMRADSTLTAPLREQMRDQMKVIEPQRDSIRTATDASIRALLTPEQLNLWDEWQAQQAKQMDERRQRLNDGRR